MCKGPIFSLTQVHSSDPLLGGWRDARRGTQVFLTVFFLRLLCPPHRAPVSLSQPPQVSAKDPMVTSILKCQFYFISHLKHDIMLVS